MEHFIIDLSVLIVATAVVATLAVIFKQPIITAYVLCGVIIGPFGFKLVSNLGFIEIISHLGITLLLFLAGLNLQPQRLMKLFAESFWVTVVNCFISFIFAFFFAGSFGFNAMESIVIGLALMFSSTILTIKLLPTTRLHQEKMGGVCIGILILQDLIAVAVLAFTRCLTRPETAVGDFVVLTIRLIFFIVILFLLERFVLRKVMTIVDRIQEVLFILGLAWCLGIATISNEMGLFYETGAFFAGVVLARHDISLFIAERLKPLRDFFLVLFFFTLGAKLNLRIIGDIIVPAMILTAMLMMLKSWLFMRSFIRAGERKAFALETGIRLGQFSEFALLIAILAFEISLISDRASQMIQLVTILSITISSYLVVFKYPTPIGVSEKLTKD